MYFPALDGCEKLKNIEVAEGNENYTSMDGVLFNKQKDELILYSYGKPKKSVTPFQMALPEFFLGVLTIVRSCAPLP